ncbi:MAG: NAD(P)/FAD-dependent oxidoreductase [Acidimicrobiales bacterium]
MTSVDVAVIGRGLIGSAAARHLAESGMTVALIGPDEPADRTTGNGPFSSHDDEWRITRIAGRTLVWSELATRSIRRYADIEARSGLDIHQRAGLVVAVPDLDEWIDHGLIMGSNVRKVDGDWLRDVTGIELPSGVVAAYEGPPAGYINPRRLVEAQTALTEAAGGRVLRGTVTSISPSSGRFQVVGDRGTISAQRVLVATGAFGRHLLGGSLSLERRPRTVVLATLTHDRPLPSLIAGGDVGDSRIEELYWVPPTRYPDGGTYLKIGGALASHPLIESDRDLIEWFHGSGDPVEVDALESSLRALLPTAAIEPVTTRPCVVTATPSGYPYVGWIDDDKMAVAIGGNGAAAKSSDEIGRLAASLFGPDGWTDTIDQGLFTPRLR